MTVYLVAYLLILVYGITVRKTKDGTPAYFATFAFCVCILIASFRGIDVGRDTNAYVALFEAFKITHNLQLVQAYIATTIEPGYLYLVRFLSDISPNQVVFFAIQYAIIYGVRFYYLRKHSSNLLCSILLFFAISFSATLNTMRQTLMFSVLLYSLDCVENKRYFWGIVGIGLASLIHHAIVIFLPCFIIYFIPNKRKYIVWWIMGSLGFGLLLCQPWVLNTFLKLTGYTRYLNPNRFQASDTAGILGWIYLLIMLIGIGVVLWRKKNVTEQYAFYLILSALGTVITLLAKYNELLARGAGYVFFITILLPAIIDQIFTKRSRHLIYGFVYVLLFIATFISFRNYEYSLYFD